MQWKKDNYTNIEMKQAVPLFICQIFSIVLSYNVFMTRYEVYAYMNLNALVSLLGIIFMNIIMFWYFDTIKYAYQYRSQMEAAELKLEYQMHYYKIIEEYQRETDSLWHDMKKHTVAMRALLEDGTHSETENYLNALENQLNSIPKVIRTKHPVISALLTTELHAAEKEGIKVQLEIKLESTMRIEQIDLCVLLGNTLENAVNACYNMAVESDRFIHIRIIQNGLSILICIKNSFEPGTTPKPHPGKHGYGLKNVQKIIKKYDGKMTVKSAEGIYEALIIIP